MADGVVVVVVVDGLPALFDRLSHLLDSKGRVGGCAGSLAVSSPGGVVRRWWPLRSRVVVGEDCLIIQSSRPIEARNV
jgi:hypothetical protein